MSIRTAKKPARAAVVAVLLLLCCATSAVAEKQQHDLYWGAWIGSQLTGTQPPYDMSAVSRFENLVGKGLSMVEFAVPFADCSYAPCAASPFPTAEMQAIRSYGAIPFLSWSSGSIPASTNQPAFRLRTIIEGRYDSYIRSFATEAATWGQPFFLRFDWEMNGSWFDWAEGANGNRPGEFVAAWRHVHDIFTSVGATNATWVWCPYSNTIGRYGKLAQYYPGNRYVDWSCLDAYNFAGSAINPHPWKSFDRLFSRAYKLVTQKVAPSKPMMLGEVASNGAAARKAQWIREMFGSVATKYPRVGGLIWFDQPDRGINWPIETATAPLRAFSTGIRPFLGPRFGNLDASPIPSLR